LKDKEINIFDNREDRTKIKKNEKKYILSNKIKLNKKEYLNNKIILKESKNSILYNTFKKFYSSKNRKSAYHILKSNKKTLFSYLNKKSISYLNYENIIFGIKKDIYNEVS